MVEVRHERDAGGTGDQIHLTVDLRGHLTEDQAARIRAVSRRCPVHRMLTTEVAITEH